MVKTIVFIAATVVAVVSLLAAAYVWVPETLTNQLGFHDAEKGATFLAATRASLSTLLGSFVTALLGGIAVASGAIAYQDYVTAKDKHASDVMSRAAELLGSENMATRLGGIYALSRLAKTSEIDYLPVFGVLTGFLRMNYGKGKGRMPVAPQATQPGKSRCPVEVQVILEIVGERSQKRLEGSNCHDLSYVHLQDAWCARCDFSSVYFWETDFENVEFTCADLTNADFTGAVLRDCNFTEAVVDGLIVCGASLGSSTGFSQDMIDRMKGDASTLLPSGLKKPSHW